MAITYVSESNSANNDDPTVNVPAGIADDDLVIVALQKDGNDNTTSLTGFTYQSSLSASEGTSEQRIFTKTASSESGSYDFADIGGAEQWVCGCIAVRDSSGFDVGSVTTVTGSTSITCTGVTVTSDNSKIFAFITGEDADAIDAPDGTWTQIYDVSTGSGTTGATGACFVKDVDSGATGNFTFSYATQTDEMIGTLMVYSPTGGEPPAAEFIPKIIVY